MSCTFFGLQFGYRLACLSTSFSSTEPFSGPPRVTDGAPSPSTHARSDNPASRSDAAAWRDSHSTI